MNLLAFIALDTDGLTFKLVDATRQGYRINPYILFDGDKNAIRMSGEYNNYNVVGFAIASKRSMWVFVK